MKIKKQLKALINKQIKSKRVDAMIRAAAENTDARKLARLLKKI